MNFTEKIARHVCERAGYAPDLMVCRFPGMPWPHGPLGHTAVPESQCAAWEVYAAIVREVLQQLRDANAVLHAIENEHADPTSTPESLWRAGVDALLVEEVVPFACDREDVNFGLVGEEVEAPAGWKKERGLV